MAAPPSDDLHIPKEELKEENFTTVRRCAESYGESAEIVEFKGTGSEVSQQLRSVGCKIFSDLLQNMDCVRVKVGEREGPLDLDRA